MEIVVIGLNHSTAPVDIREKITFPGDDEGMVTRTLREIEGVEEVVVLSTCNRAEVVALTVDADESPDRLVKAIGALHDVDPESFRSFLYVKTQREAVRHLFRVAASLDSMVLGEPQILGQVKEGYRRATKVKATGPILNRLMHRAFFTAKRVRNETGVGNAAVSVAYVAVELANKILGDLKNKQILMIGAGEMAELAARHLTSHVEQPICVANRTYENACSLASELCGEVIPMEELDSGLERADVVITSTSGREPLIERDPFKQVMRRRRFRPIFIIDIAIPRDVAPEVNDLDGVYLYNIDDLQGVANENIGERRREAVRAERIVAEEVTKFLDWTRSLEAAPTIIALKDRLEKIRRDELSRLNGKLSKLSPEEREAVEILTRSMINKIAHDPIMFLKRAGRGSRRNLHLDTAQRLFKLDGLSTSPLNGDEEPERQ